MSQISLTNQLGGFELGDQLAPSFEHASRRLLVHMRREELRQRALLYQRYERVCQLFRSVIWFVL